jgi:glycerol-3-phosphate dehydrogenase
MNRSQVWSQIAGRSRPWDMLVIGGGATGVGVAIDAAARGYDVLLLEQSDFGKGTSSRSTKLAHGGVRYLEQGNVGLVMQALRERDLLAQNAPHVVHDLAFIVPSYSWWEAPFYGIGLKLYQLLARHHAFGSTRMLSREETLGYSPNLKAKGLRGGALYHDGQFDDARLLINMVSTAHERGAALLNYTAVAGFIQDSQGNITGVQVRDEETGREFPVASKVVINATGAFSDRLRQLAQPEAPPMIAPSQGIHLVFRRSFLPGQNAIIIPHTSDGRVLFAIPWYGHTLVGTTDTPVSAASLEPVAMEHEIDFILSMAAQYLAKAPTRRDVLSVFAGVRPLVRSGKSRLSAALSRDHRIHVDRSGLVSVMGGKWTTCRRMAEDCVDQAARLAGLPGKACPTPNLRIHGFHESRNRFGSLAVYGSDAPAILELVKTDSALGQSLHSDLPYIGAEVLWAVRQEMARTVEDVLARRTRALFLNARAALEMAPRVAAIMAAELGWSDAIADGQIAAFREVASHYILPA